MKHTYNNLGQASMELILIMVIITSVAMKLSTMAKDRGIVSDIVEGPWSTIRGMIEDGVWEKHTDSKPLHPNHKNRHQTTAGESK